MRIAFAPLVLVALLVPLVALAQQPQLTCIPGTNVCMDAQGRVHLGGGVGPGGASATATASGRGNATAPPPPPPPPAPAPAPTPAPAPAPTPAPAPAPTPAPTLAPPPAPSYAPPSYGRGSSPTVALALCPAMRVGVDSGFRFGGGLCMAFFGDEWGFGLDVFGLSGGTGPGVTELSFHLSALYRFDPHERMVDGFFLRAGPEFRTGFIHGTTTREENWHMGVEIGGGYDMNLGSLFWRVIELRPYAAIRLDGQPTPDDRFGNKHDLGVLVTSGIGFN